MSASLSSRAAGSKPAGDPAPAPARRRRAPVVRPIQGLRPYDRCAGGPPHKSNFAGGGRRYPFGDATIPAAPGWTCACCTATMAVPALWSAHDDEPHREEADRQAPQPAAHPGAQGAADHHRGGGGGPGPRRRRRAAGRDRRRPDRPALDEVRPHVLQAAQAQAARPKAERAPERIISTGSGLRGPRTVIVERRATRPWSSAASAPARRPPLRLARRLRGGLRLPPVGVPPDGVAQTPAFER